MLTRIEQGYNSALYGTLLSIAVTLDPSDLLKSAVLAAVGTTTSVIVSLLIKRLLK